jgi:hypothetical protein
MSDYVLMIAALGAVILFCAWREYAGENRRDAKVLAVGGVGAILASAAVGWSD